MMLSSIARLVATYVVFFTLTLVEAKVSMANLRNKAAQKTSVEHRRLNWEMLAPGYANVTNDVWYSDYSTSEIPTEPSPWADTTDKFRTNDLCIKNGIYTRANCPTELDCSHLSDPKIGPAKLCINRVPTTTGMWYVLLQKCIPEWENCDKCLCGVMTSSGSNGVCVFDPNCGSDDSRIEIDCSNPSRVIVMGDYTFNSATGEGFVDIESLQMTESVETSSPMIKSKVPTPSPAGSNGIGTSAPVSGTASKPTEIPVAVSPTENPVKAPKPTEPPVSTPNPTEPPVSTPEPTKPQVTVSVPTEAPASEEQVDTGGEDGTSETEQVDSVTSTTENEGHDFVAEDLQH